MSLYNILKEKTCPLPFINRFCELDDFTWFLMEKLNEYSYEVQNSVLHHDFSDKMIAISNMFKIKTPDFINSIGLVLETYYNNPEKSYQLFSDSLKRNGIIEYLKKMPKEINVIHPGYSFFRAQSLDLKKERKCLFHLPFENKDSAANCRYSREGVPALYLSDSLEFASREKRKDNFIAARFENISEIEIINVDFSYFLSSNIENIIMEEQIRLQFLGMIWPLVTACSIVREEGRDDYFEYIFPQLLIRYVIENEVFDGIRYFSTRIDSNNEKEHNNHYNLVLPTKSSKTTGYDENLCKLFKMTDVIEVKKGEISKAQSILEGMPAFEIDFK